MPKYLSGRSKKNPDDKLSVDRYKYLSLGDAEANPGDPQSSGISEFDKGSVVGGFDPPTGSTGYTLVTYYDDARGLGTRYWEPVGGGIIPGSSTVKDEGKTVGTADSITTFNFVGSSLTAVAVTGGTIATMTIQPPGEVGSVLFKENIDYEYWDSSTSSWVSGKRDDFNTSSDLVFNSSVGILTVGQGINIGAGGTIFSVVGVATTDPPTGINTGFPSVVGIGTTNPQYNLHVFGNIGISSGTIYDVNNFGGSEGDIIIKNDDGYIEWKPRTQVVTSAGGTIGNIQFHSGEGFVEGTSDWDGSSQDASNAFVWDSTNYRVGIGSTQPSAKFDVTGDSKFTGVSTFVGLTSVIDGGFFADDVYVSTASTFVGFSTFKDSVYIAGIATIGDIKIEDNKIYNNDGNLVLESAADIVQVNDQLYISVTNESTTVNSGALQVNGGAGINKNLNVGGATSLAGYATSENTYNYELSETSISIGTSEFYFDQDNYTTISTIKIHKTDDDSGDNSTLLESLRGGDRIETSYSLGSSSQSITYKITGDSTVSDDVYTLPISYLSVSFITGLSSWEDVPYGNVFNVTITQRGEGSVYLASSGGITTTGGDLYVKGDLYTNNDIVSDEGLFQRLNVTGVATFHGNVHALSNVGIGTTDIDSSTKLHIKDTTVNQIKQETTDSTGYSLLKFITSSGDGVKDKYMIGYNDGHTSQADELSLKNQTGDITFIAGGTSTSEERLRITSDGKIGIGTTTPNSLLYIKSDDDVAGQESAGITTVLTLETTRTDMAAGKEYGPAIRFYNHDNTFDSEAFIQANCPEIYGGGVPSQLTSLSASGSGYISETNVTTDAITGSGSGLTVNITVDGTGAVQNPVTINTPGSGYRAGDEIKIVQGDNEDAKFSIFKLDYEAKREKTLDFNFKQKDNGTLKTTMTIKGEGGYVGIGTTTPAYSLDLGKSPSTIRLVSENDGTAIRMGAGGGSNDFTIIRVDGAANRPHGETDNSNFGFSLKYMGARSGNSNSLSLFPDNQTGTQFEAITILQDGNVGINQNNPNKAKLHVSADTGSTEKIVAKFRNPEFAADVKAKIGLVAGYSDTANDVDAHAYVGAQREGSGNNASLFFETTNGSTATEVLRITGIGSVGIGSTNPDVKLHIFDDTHQIRLGHIESGTTSTDAGVIFKSDDVSIGTTGKLGGVFTEVNGKILSYGINVPQLESTSGIDTYRTGGIFRLDTRDSGSFGNANCFVVKGRSIGTTVEYDSVVINLHDGNTILVPDKGYVGIGTTNPNKAIDLANGNTGITTLAVAGIVTTHHIYANHIYGPITGALTPDGLIDIESYIQHKDNTDTKFGFPENDTFTVNTDGSERIRIDSSGRLLVGHTATVDTSTYNSNLQIMGTDADGSSITVGRFSDDASAPSLNFSKSRGESVGIASTVKNNDVIGNIFWWGSDSATSDGGDYEEVAHIGVQAGAAFTSGSTPGDLTFWTTPVDATEATEKFRITSDGKISQGGHIPTYEYDLRGTGLQSILIGSENASGAMLILDGDSNGDGAGTDYASILHSTDGNIEINNRKSADILFKTTSSEIERLRITSAGKLIITPNITETTAHDYAGVYITSENASSGTPDGFFINNIAGDIGDNASLTFSTDSGHRKKSAISHVDTGDYGKGDLVFSVSNQHLDTDDFNIIDDEKLRITGIGSVGIGTSNPDKLLTVGIGSTAAYSLDASNTPELNTLLTLTNKSGTNGIGTGYYSSMRFSIADGATSQGWLSFIRTADNQGDFTFKARNTADDYPELMRIKSDGNVGIGTDKPTDAISSDNGNTGITTLAVAGIVTAHNMYANKFYGDLEGSATGSVSSVGSVTGNVGGSVGSVSGNVGSVGSGSGNVVLGNVDGNVTGDVGSVNSGGSNTDTAVTGNITGNVSGSVNGVGAGGITGEVSGEVSGEISGTISGNITGDITGAMNGNAASATNVKTIKKDDLTTGYLTFVDSNNDTATAETVYTTTGITVDSSTNNITATTFTGSLNGGVSGSVSGSVGSVSGNVGSVGDGTGSNVILGNVAGNINGNITGNVEGNVLGNVVGTATSLSGGLTNYPQLVIQTAANTTEFLERSGNSNYILATNNDKNDFEWVEKPASGLTNVSVTQYKQGTTERSCTSPISIINNSTIGIASTSNAYGNKFIQSSDPSATQTVCDGDIWYDISDGSGAVPASTSPPGSTSSPGTAGDIRYSASHLYICVATNSWKRVAVDGW